MKQRVAVNQPHLMSSGWDFDSLEGIVCAPKACALTVHRSLPRTLMSLRDDYQCGSRCFDDDFSTMIRKTTGFNTN